MSIPWSNQNEFRKYPFREEASLLSLGGVSLPTQLVADLQCSVDGGARELYLWKAYVTSTTVSIILAAGATPVLACTVGRTTILPWQTYAMASLDGLSAGQVVFGDTANIDPIALEFSGYGASGIEPRCVRGWRPEVKSIGRRGDSHAASGLVILSAGTNLSLSVDLDGCYHVLNSGCTGYVGLYLPAGTMSSRPLYLSTSGARKLYYQSNQWKLSSVGGYVDYYTDDAYPDRPDWVRASDSSSVDPGIVRSSLVDVGISNAIMPTFLGPGDRQSIAGSCGAPVLRSLGGATTDADGHINIIAVAEPS